MRTPKQDGFRMPAEWTAHERTWMMWPSRAEVWDDMEVTRANYTAVAHAIRAFEPLTMLVRAQDEAAAKSMLGSDIDVLVSPIDDSWARDAGPCFVTDGKGGRAGVSFRFNAWGETYAPYDGDDSAADAILNAAGVPIYHSNLIAEGGGVTVDGQGTIITTDTCFPNANRNPDWTRDQIENELKEMLGGEKVIWLPGSELELETNGHVDGIAAFVAPGVCIVESSSAQKSDWDAIIDANNAALDGQTDVNGNPIRMVAMPYAMGDYSDHDKFCTSYVNSYICNGGVVMPKYGIKEDDMVAEIFQDLFPDRRISQVEIPSIAIGGGGIHCITQQEPKS